MSDSLKIDVSHFYTTNPGLALPIGQFSDESKTVNFHTGTREAYIDYYEDPGYQYYFKTGKLISVTDLSTGKKVKRQPPIDISDVRIVVNIKEK